jgi:hypothetical protein
MQLAILRHACSYDAKGNANISFTRLPTGNHIMRVQTLIGLTAIIIQYVATVAYAETTEWMSKSQAENFAQNSKSNKIYPTQIDCKDGLLIRFTTKSLGSEKPFHKWNWVVGKASDLDKLVGRLKRSDKFELKYQIISKKAFTGADGLKYGCAIAYR